MTGRLLLACFLLWCAGSCFAAQQDLPNVLLVSLDTVRADHLSAYGYDRWVTPMMDRLSKNGTLFVRCTSQAPWTLPSHMSVFTGMYTASHGVDTDGVALPEIIPTVGELFAAAGYRTAGFISAGYVGPAFGFQRGFDTYIKIPSPLEHGTEKITASGMDFLDTWHKDDSGSPFFLFLHYLDAHTPYDPPPPLDRLFDPEYKGSMTGWAKDFSRYFNPNVPFENPADLRHLVALYDGELRRVDNGLGHVIDKLGDLGVYENTIIVVFSDHGEEFKEHAGLDHGRTLYAEQIHTPLLVIFPRKWPVGMIIDDPVQNIDILPTLLSLAGRQIPFTIEGKNLLPLVRPKLFQRMFYKHHRATFSQTNRPNLRLSTVVMDNYKFVLKDKPRELKELYDLDNDAAELHNLVEEKPEQAEQLFGVLADWLAETYLKKGQTQPAVMDDETIDHLRKIGYNFAGISKAAEGALNGPQGLAISPRGRLYVADTLNDQIKVLNDEKQIVASLGSGFGADFWAEGEFHVPVYLAFDGKGFLYASELGNKRVQCLDASRQFHHFIQAGSTSGLTDVAGIAVDKDEYLYVCDPEGKKIVVFDPTGHPSATITSLEPGGIRFNRPVCIGVLDDKTIYVGDVGLEKILVFSVDGSLINEWRVPSWRVYSNPRIQVPYPHLAVHRTGSLLYVTDPSAGGIIRYTLDGKQRLFYRHPERIDKPTGLAVSEDGLIHVSDYTANTIITLDDDAFLKRND
ncbi:sulfatase-like hydrolase/transferase [bacterium]|nr:sulfatase-like hydrolase/transferase [candidate division CSSED10-310 bacterium]